MTRYAIENTSGQWWTGECWGVVQAREEYALDGLPEELPADNSGTAGVLSLISDGDPRDWCYCDLDREEGHDGVASVREV